MTLQSTKYTRLEAKHVCVHACVRAYLIGCKSLAPPCIIAVMTIKMGNSRASILFILSLEVWAE